MNPSGLWIAIFALPLFALPVASAPFELVDLGDFGEIRDRTATATSVNNRRTAVGAAIMPVPGPFLSDLNHAFRWSDSVGLEDIGSLARGVVKRGGRTSVISDTGHIVGTGIREDGTLAPIRWLPGATMPTELNPLLTADTFAIDVNDAGQVVGQQDDQIHFWDSDNTETILQFPDAIFANCVGINNAGSILGFMFTSDGPRGFLLPSIGASPILFGAIEVVDMNESGQILAKNLAGNWEIITDLGLPTQNILELPAEFQLIPWTSLNDDGSLVGLDGNQISQWNMGTGLVQLNSQITTFTIFGFSFPYGGGLRFRFVDDNNNSDWIVGEYDFANTRRAFLLRPIPETSSVLLICLGVLAIASVRWLTRQTRNKRPFSVEPSLSVQNTAQ